MGPLTIFLALFPTFILASHGPRDDKLPLSSCEITTDNPNLGSISALCKSEGFNGVNPTALVLDLCLWNDDGELKWAENGTHYHSTSNISFISSASLSPGGPFSLIR